MKYIHDRTTFSIHAFCRTKNCLNIPDKRVSKKRSDTHLTRPLTIIALFVNTALNSPPCDQDFT